MEGEDIFKHTSEEAKNCYSKLKDNSCIPDKTSTFQESLEEFVKSGIPWYNLQSERYETLLHRAIKFKDDKQSAVVTKLIVHAPELLGYTREKSKEYKGQSPLHLAVCKGDYDLVNEIVEALATTSSETGTCRLDQNDETNIADETKQNDKAKTTLYRRGDGKGNVRRLMRKNATGTEFQNTAMIGELPLSISALVFNEEIFNRLLKEGADITARNSQGDNVFHSLIKYSHLYPDKGKEALTMFITVGEHKMHKIKPEKMWFVKNGNKLNPLQLAAKLGQYEIFEFIIKQKTYCYSSRSDGLFDINIYDITEIDTVSGDIPEENNPDRQSDKETQNNIGVKKVNQVACCPGKTETQQTNQPPESHQKPILVMINELKPSLAFSLLQFPAIHRIVNDKWKAYHKYFYPWFALHFIFMCFLTWYATERSIQNYNAANSTAFDVDSVPIFTNMVLVNPFVTAYAFIAVVYAVLYIVIECVMLKSRLNKWSLNSVWNPYGNGIFRVLFLLMSFCLLVDVFTAMFSKHYENYFLILGVLIGWYLMVFFLRAIKGFSFFPVLIHKVLVGDMLVFSVILAIEIVAFGTAMFMAVQGSDNTEEEEFSSFGRVAFSMAKLMVGIGDPASLYQTRHPVISILTLIGFIVMTTILLFNALIAQMSETCSVLAGSENKKTLHYQHLKLQRLSLILYIESVLPKNWRKQIGVMESGCTRYILKIKSRRKVDSTTLDDDADVEDFSAFVKSKSVKNREKKSKEKGQSFKYSKHSIKGGNTYNTYGSISDDQMPSKPMHSTCSLDIYQMRVERPDTCQCQCQCHQLVRVEQ